MFPLRAIINISVALGIHPNMLTLIGVLINVVANGAQAVAARGGGLGRPQPPQQFVDGTRLFAYRALRPKLSCRELSLAIGEIAVASRRLLDPASAVPQERAQSVAALASDVSGELASEQASRCTTATGARSSANSDARSQ